MAWNAEQAKSADRAGSGSESRVTISSIGRRLPPRPSWWKGAEVATVQNRQAAEALTALARGEV